MLGCAACFRKHMVFREDRAALLLSQHSVSEPRERHPKRLEQGFHMEVDELSGRPQLGEERNPDPSGT